MERSGQDIGASFDARAERYNQNEWHRACAERLVTFSRVGPGSRVLDAGTGTGFAAIAAARAVGAKGQVVAIDLSEGMLRVARQHEPEPASAPIQWVHGNAVDIAVQSAGAFDAVLCAAALLYMPVAAALAEWHRLLRPRGTIAVSSMRAGSPVAGRLFRQCAATFGFHLADPSEALGSESACHQALAAAGFTDITISGIRLPFTALDTAMAWESNLASGAHEAVRAASPDVLGRMKSMFEAALEQHERQVPGSTTSAEILLVRGTR